MFNNWVKSVLIKNALAEFRSKYSHLGISVLDLGCGKGGDLKKYNYERVANYVGVDISLGQLRDAIMRKVNGKIDFPMLCIRNPGQADPEQFYKHIPKNLHFDVVSAQFCIHYFFENEANVRNFLSNVSFKLVRDGLFVATFPDADVILKKLVNDGNEVSRYLVTENGDYSIIMDSGELDKETPFGLKYGFFLDEELIGQKEERDGEIRITYVPEYLINLPRFIEIAKEFGLEVHTSRNFHEFYADNIKNESHFSLFRKMNFQPADYEHLMEESVWDCSYLYR